VSGMAARRCSLGMEDRRGHEEAIRRFLRRIEDRAPDEPDGQGHRWMDNDCVQRVTDSFSELAQIKVTDVHTERLPGAPSGLVLDPFNEEETVRLMDKDQVVPNDPIISNKWRWRWDGYAPRGLPDAIDASYESLDCAETSSILRRYKDARSPRLWAKERWMDFRRYLIVLIIGPITALVAISIEESIKFLTSYKYEMLANLYNAAFDKGGTALVWPYLFGTGFNLVAGAIAAACVFISPAAQGSGIPQIKCYLNGVNVPRLVRIKTMVSKVVGVIFSVTAGFAVGKEGPMIHSGAAVGAGISQGKSSSLILGLFPIKTKIFRDFRTDKEKRDFVACGAAAGVSAAFGAPMGGLLFAIEEGASHVNQPMLWRAAICSCLSFATLSLIKSWILGVPGQISNGGLISFGAFDNAYYNGWRFVVFIAMGVMGAISGAAFNSLNKAMTMYRMRSVHFSKWYKALEVLLCAVAVSLVAYIVVTNDRNCERIDLHAGNGGQTPFSLNCPFGYVNSAANLWYKTPESVVKSLLHDSIDSHHHTTLLCFVPFYWALACWTYGMGISNGLFVPSLLIGAAWGRLVGMSLHHYAPDVDWGDVGKYALIGACAQLAGTVRLTYSLTAIVIEAIGNLTYLFPILMTVVVSKHLADLYNKGIYDIHIDLLGIPMMEAAASVKARFIAARHIMSTPVQVLPIQARVKDVLDILKRTSHNAFPVVDTPPDLSAVSGTGAAAGQYYEDNSNYGDEEDQDDANCDNRRDGQSLPVRYQANPPHYGRLRGIIGRNEIMTMISKKIFVNSEEVGAKVVRESYGKLREHYPRFPQAEAIDMSPEDQAKFCLDFSLAMNLAPVAVNASMTYTALYDMVRKCGLRHVVVVNHNNQVVGMITRKDLVVLEEEPQLFSDPVIKYKPAYFPAKFREGTYQTLFQEVTGCNLRRRRRQRNYSSIIEENVEEDRSSHDSPRL